MSNLNSIINGFLQEGACAIKEGMSRSGEEVRIKVIQEEIRKNKTHVTYQVVGKTGEVYDTLNYEFTGLQKPYYYLEVLKLSLLVYWSGIFLSKKDLKRMEFIERFGEQYNEYLNKSLKKIYFIKKIALLWRRSS